MAIPYFAVNAKNFVIYDPVLFPVQMNEAEVKKVL
jgi:hypothetical protein